MNARRESRAFRRNETRSATGAVETGRDAELMRALHQEHVHALWSFVLYLTGGDRERAEDVVQETLLRAWKHPEVLEGPDSSSRSWLFTVARNIVVDQWRAGRRRQEDMWADPPETAEPDTTDNALQAMLVGEALRQLSADHRAVLLECYYGGRTAAQAAARLGIPIGTVKSRVHYALHALGLALQEMGVVT